MPGPTALLAPDVGMKAAGLIGADVPCRQELNRLFDVTARVWEHLPGGDSQRRAVSVLHVGPDVPAALAEIDRLDGQRRTYVPLPRLPEGIRTVPDLVVSDDLEIEHGILHAVVRKAMKSIILDGESLDDLHAITVPVSAVVAYPGASWFTYYTGGRYFLHDQGAGAPAVDPLLPPDLGPTLATGSGHLRTVFAEGHPFAVISSSDDGVTWREHDTAFNWDSSSQDPQTGAIDIFTALPDGRGRLYHFESSAPFHPTPVAVSFSDLYGSCRAERVIWSAPSGNAMFRVEPPNESTVHIEGAVEATLEDCDASRALVRSATANTIELCDTTACKVVLHVDTPFAGSASLTPRGWVFASAVDDIVAIWTSAAPDPTLYRLPPKFLLKRVAVIGGTSYLLAADPDEHVHFIAIP